MGEAEEKIDGAPAELVEEEAHEDQDVCAEEGAGSAAPEEAAATGADPNADADSEAGEAAESGEGSAEPEPEEELFEVEVSEDDIYAYIVDEDDNEIGFILLDENGEEQEYYYADDDADSADAADGEASEGDDFDFGITREGVAETTADLNAIYKDGVAIASEFKGAFDDIMDGLSFMKKK